MSADEKKKFYQVHLGLLQAGPDWRHKLNLMSGEATITAGACLEKKLGTEVAKNKIKEVGPRPSREFAPSNWQHRAWALGRDVVAVTWHDRPRRVVECYNMAVSFLEHLGKSPLVRFDSQLVMELERGQFSWRDFTVLLAIFAVIGDKQYAIVHRDRVRAGALGYSSARVLFDKDGNLTADGNSILSKREDGAQPLTLDQVRYTIERLHLRKFISKIQPKRCGRTVYYSRSLSHDELAEKLITRLERKNEVQFAQEQAERKLRDRAALLKRGISGDKKEPESVPAQSPDQPRTVPAEVPAGVPALIYACPNSCPSNSFAINGCPPNGEAGVSSMNRSEETEPETPELTPPTLDDVAALFKSLMKNPELPTELAPSWFEKHGADPKWLEQDWRLPSAKWAMDPRRRKP